MNDHEVNSFDSGLFPNSEDFPLFSGGFLADSGVNENAVTPCLSSAFQNPLAADVLQARSGKQCTTPVKNSDSDSGVNVNIDPVRDLSAGFGIQWAGSDPQLCPYERYGPRSVPVCDSGILYDIVEDESRWTYELVNPTICMYDLIIALFCRIELVCSSCLKGGVFFLVFGFEIEQNSPNRKINIEERLIAKHGFAKRLRVVMELHFVSYIKPYLAYGMKIRLRQWIIDQNDRSRNMFCLNSTGLVLRVLPLEKWSSIPPNEITRS